MKWGKVGLITLTYWQLYNEETYIYNSDKVTMIKTNFYLPNFKEYTLYLEGLRENISTELTKEQFEFYLNNPDVLAMEVNL